MNVAVSKEIENLADVMYTTYSREVGGVAFNGDPLPTWEEFYNDHTKEKQSNAWLHAAVAGWSHIDTLDKLEDDKRTTV
jgi:hypothetical protein